MFSGETAVGGYRDPTVPTINETEKKGTHTNNSEHDELRKQFILMTKYERRSTSGGRSVLENSRREKKKGKTRDDRPADCRDRPAVSPPVRRRPSPSVRNHVVVVVVVHHTAMRNSLFFRCDSYSTEMIRRPAKIKRV